MGANYYFEAKNIDKIIQKIKGISSLISQDSINYIMNELSEIHIGKRSMGWKPLFKKQEYYSNIRQLKDFYLSNKDYLIIKDECGMEITWEELEERLIECNIDGKSHKEYHGNKTSGDKSMFEMLTKDYYIDEYGYEWSNREFS